MKKCSNCNSVIIPNNDICFNCGNYINSDNNPKTTLIADVNSIECINCPNNLDTSSQILSNRFSENDQASTYIQTTNQKINNEVTLELNNTNVLEINDNTIIDEWYLRRINLNKALNYLKYSLEKELNTIEKEINEIKQNLEIAKRAFQQLFSSHIKN